MTKSHISHPRADISSREIGKKVFMINPLYFRFPIKSIDPVAG